MSKEGQTKYLYVVFIKALTKVGAVSRVLNQYEYTNIAVCLDERLTDFITFSRRKHNAPFDVGFMHETRNCYAFGKHKKVKVRVYKVPVQDSNYKLLEAYIENIENDQEYLFNMFSIVTMPILHGLPIYKTHNCMSFTGKLLSLSGTICMKKPFFRYSIKEMEALVKPYFYKEGYLKKQACGKEDYMEPVRFSHNVAAFIKLNERLIYRLVYEHRTRIRLRS